MTKKTVLHLVKKLTNEIKNAAQEIEKEKNKKIQMLTKILNHALLKQKLNKFKKNITTPHGPQVNDNKNIVINPNETNDDFIISEDDENEKMKNDKNQKYIEKKIKLNLLIPIKEGNILANYYNK